MTIGGNVPSSLSVFVAVIAASLVLPFLISPRRRAAAPGSPQIVVVPCPYCRVPPAGRAAPRRRGAPAGSRDVRASAVAARRVGRKTR